MSPVRRRLAGRSARDERGATAVEFAFVMLPLLYLIFGIVQYGLYFYAMQSGTSATSEAVRRLTVGDCQTVSQLRDFIRVRLGNASTTSSANLVFYDSSGATTTGPVYKDASGTVVASPGVIGGSVLLSVKYSAINMNFPFLPLPKGGDIVRTVTGRVEDTVATGGGCS